LETKQILKLMAGRQFSDCPNWMRSLFRNFIFKIILIFLGVTNGQPRICVVEEPPSPTSPTTSKGLKEGKRHSHHHTRKTLNAAKKKSMSYPEEAKSRRQSVRTSMALATGSGAGQKIKKSPRNLTIDTSPEVRYHFGKELKK